MQLLSSVSQHDFAWLAAKLSNLGDDQILPVHGHFLELDLKEDKGITLHNICVQHLVW